MVLTAKMFINAGINKYVITDPVKKALNIILKIYDPALVRYGP